MIPTREECFELIEEFPMLYNIFRHTTLVTDVASYLAHELNKTELSINEGIVEAGALLHDVTKTYDLLDRLTTKDNLFIWKREKVKLVAFEELTKMWDDIAKTYNLDKDRKHADTAVSLVEQKGYEEIVPSILNHTKSEIPLDPIEEYHLVYYADKRVMDDSIVTVEKRFELLKKRYTCTSNYFDKSKETTKALEELIFKDLTILPISIQTMINPSENSI